MKLIVLLMMAMGAILMYFTRKPRQVATMPAGRTIVGNGNEFPLIPEATEPSVRKVEYFTVGEIVGYDGLGRPRARFIAFGPPPDCATVQRTAHHQCPGAVRVLPLSRIFHIAA